MLNHLYNFAEQARAYLSGALSNIQSTIGPAFQKLQPLVAQISTSLNTIKATLTQTGLDITGQVAQSAKTCGQMIKDIFNSSMSQTLGQMLSSIQGRLSGLVSLVRTASLLNHVIQYAQQARDMKDTMDKIPQEDRSFFDTLKLFLLNVLVSVIDFVKDVATLTSQKLDSTWTTAQGYISRTSSADAFTQTEPTQHSSTRESRSSSNSSDDFEHVDPNAHRL